MKLGDRENFTTRVYKQLREALMAGRFWPSQRLRIGELAVAMGVSQTPVREAIMQLVREGGLDIRSSQSITVANLSLSRYKELREVRLLLEGLATEKATPLITVRRIGAARSRFTSELIAAERSGDYETATLANFHFHFLIYRASQMSDLVAILESVWLRNGPLLKYLYPYAPPTYPGQHQHLTLMEALRAPGSGRRSPGGSGRHDRGRRAAGRTDGQDQSPARRGRRRPRRRAAAEVSRLEQAQDAMKEAQA